MDFFTNVHEVNCHDKDSKYGGHLFDLSTIVSTFGGLVDGKCTTPGPCPLCRGRVTEAKPIPGLQRTIDAFKLILGQEEEENPISKMKELINAMQVNKRIEDLGKTYPLAATEFYCRKDVSTWTNTYLEILFSNKIENN